MQSLSKQTLAYAAGTILSKLQGFILLPIITRYLTPHDYGILETLTTISFFVSIFSTLNIDAGIGTFYHEQPDDRQRRSIASSGLWLNQCMCIILAITASIVVPQFVRRLQGAAIYSDTLLLTIFTALLTGIASVHSTVLRLKFKTFHFNLMTVGGAFLTFLLSFLFVVNFKWGVSGVIWANLVVASTATIVGIGLNYTDLITRPKRMIWQKLLTAALPLLPFSVAAWVIAFADRTILVTYRTLDEVGIYALAARFSAIAAILFGPFQTAWWPYAMASWQQPQARDAFVRIFRVFIVSAGALTVIIAGASPIALYWLMPYEYFDAARYVGLLVICNLLVSLYFFPLVSLMLNKKSWITSFAYSVGAIINILLNFVWVPTYGVAGATWATVIGYTVMLTLVTVWAHRILPIAYPYAKAVILLLALLVMATIPFLWATENVTLMIVQLLVNSSLYAALVLVTGLADDEMLQSVKTRFDNLVFKLQSK